MNKAEELFRLAGIEVYGVCKKCGTHWCTLEENKKIKKCKNGCAAIFMETYCNYDDTLSFIKKHLRPTDLHNN